MHLVGELGDEGHQVLARRPALTGAVLALPRPGRGRPGPRGEAGHGRLAPALLASRPAEKLLGVRVLAGQLVGDVGDALAQRLRGEAALGVGGDLLGAAPVRLVDRPLHRGSDLFGVPMYLAGAGPPRAADPL